MRFTTGFLVALSVSMLALFSAPHAQGAPTESPSFKTGMKEYDAKNYAEARRLFEIAAEGGDANGSYGLGLMYLHGDGVSQDVNEALRRFTAASSAGHATAPAEIALMYLGSKVTIGNAARQREEAVKWFKVSADRRYAMAEYAYARLVIGDPMYEAEAIRYLQRAAAQGNSDAKAALEEKRKEQEAERARIRRLEEEEEEEEAEFGF
jgi:TPR repeat protein